MGASVQPVPAAQPSPAEIARIQGNVAKMRAQRAPESDVLSYLQHEDSLASASPSGPDPTALSLRNIGRSLTQGATFGWGDELLGKLPSGMGGGDQAEADMRTNAAAFHSAHPVVDFLSKLAGGIAAPVAAVAAAPEALGGVGGAALVGAGAGALSGAGEADNGDRLRGALIGGATGAVLGPVGYGLGKVGSKAIGMIADRIHPENAVRRAAAGLLDPSVRARLADVDAIAPGGSSIATAAVPADGAPVSRFLPMLRAIGANEDAAKTVEGTLGSQRVALKTARKALGAKMDALNTAIPVDPQVTATLANVGDVLGGKAPTLSTGQTHIDAQEMRDALSRLRYMERQAVKRGTEANGPNLHDIQTARASLQSLLYDRIPGFADLDKPYAIASRELKSVQDATKTVQRSRANYAGNEAYKATSGSLGGSLPAGRHGVIMSTLDQILTNRAGAADAVARLVAKPGGPELVDQILSNVPKKAGTGASRYIAPTVAGSFPALRGLLTPPAQP